MRAKLRSATWLLLHVRESVLTMQESGSAIRTQQAAVARHLQRAQDIVRDANHPSLPGNHELLEGVTSGHINQVATRARHIIEWMRTEIVGFDTMCAVL